jgi:GH3 auxin-responsive promoter
VLLIHAGMAVNYGRHWRPVDRMASRPAATQLDVLRRLLASNRDTRFGVEHRFRAIRSHADLVNQVPVHDYEMLRPYVEEQRRTGQTALTAEPPLFYAQTSGTTGTPKFIPMTASMLAIHRHEQALFTYLQYRARPSAFAGKSLGIMGAAVEGRLDSGHAVGSVSGHLYRSLPRVVRARFVVPPEVSDIADYNLKYLVIVRLALGEDNITYLGSPNPTTFLRLLEVIGEHRDALRASLETGRLEALDSLDAAARDAIAPRIRPHRARAAQLASGAVPTYADLWPGIRLVTTWTGGSCGIALDKLREKLPPTAAVMELGYQATEFRGTIALEPETPGGLPPLHHHFFEFVEQAKWDDGRPEFLTLAELVPGGRYYILITTASGLYRYFMNDLVEVTGFFRQTPLLRFVQKGKGVTSLTGEKLYEAQAIDAVRMVTARSGVSSSFFLLVADEAIGAYRLFVELDDEIRPEATSIAAAIDLRLGEINLEYHAKRESGRLGALTIAWLKRGTGEAYKVACVRAGQREGQFKPPVLQYRRDLALPIEQYVVSQV